jgi:hypothetical protein
MSRFFCQYFLFFCQRNQLFEHKHLCQKESDIETDPFYIGHLFHGVSKAFTPQPVFLVPSVGHVVDTERRDVVDDDPADVEPSDGLERFTDVVGPVPCG